MKRIIQIEELALLILFSIGYFIYSDKGWTFYLLVFFVPDISFLAYLINKKVGAITYNLLHHRGVAIFLILLGYYLQLEMYTAIGLIFLAHASFDRMLGYGLKYYDSFQHTHLGWIGKKS